MKIIYLIVVTAALYTAFSQWAYDDPYITYRYAHNLASGAGLVYNPGERVLSTTAPLYAVLLAGLSLLWNDIPHLANLIGAASLALGGLFLWDIGRSWKTPAAGWAALLLYPSFGLLILTLGSETPLYLAFGLGAIAAYARQRFYLTAFFSSLTLLLRPDGVLVPAILGVDYLLSQRKAIPWKALLLFIALSLPWFAVAWAAYGSPFPATLAAKQHQGAMAISQRFAPGFLQVLRWHRSGWQFWAEGGLALLGAGWALLRARRWWMILAWSGLYFLAYTILGVTSYHWYYAPLAPGFLAGVGLGIQALLEGMQWLARRMGSWLARAPALVTAVLVLALTGGQVVNLQQIQHSPDTRPGIYRAVGEWLQQNTPQDASVGSLEIGIIGYYAQRPMIDFAGLLQPSVAQILGPETTFDDAAWWANAHYHPDFLVLISGWLPRLEALASQQCRELRIFDGAAYGYNGKITIFGCS